MAFTLPAALHDPDDDAVALDHLERYFHRESFTGALFDDWDSTGTRAQDTDRFTADDLVAVTFLSVQVPAAAAEQLLRSRSAEFSSLFAELGPDRDLVDEWAVGSDGWEGWPLMAALDELPGVGTTTASKLLARKRPQLRPIWDTVVADVTGTQTQQWAPLQQALAANDRALHTRLQRLHTTAGLSEAVTVLRVFDVICWMEGKATGRGGSAPRVQA